MTLVSDDPKTNTLTLAAGESAKLVFVRQMKIEGALDLGGSSTSALEFRIGVGDKFFPIGPVAAGGLTLAGPSVIRINGVAPQLVNSWRGVATFEVTRVGIATPPAEVPQEAGSNFDVILEQSSDLVNWTPANPGTYSGTETKRFFRTRIVKKP